MQINSFARIVLTLENKTKASNYGPTTTLSSNHGGLEATPARASPSKSFSQPLEVGHSGIFGSTHIEEDRELKKLQSHGRYPEYRFKITLVVDNP